MGSNGSVRRHVPRFPSSLARKFRSYLGHSQVDQVCCFTALVNYVFNIGGINCNPNVSFSDILGSLANIASQGNVLNVI